MTASESALAGVFEDQLRNGFGLKLFPKFQAIYTEVAGPQGVADFIAIHGSGWNRLVQLCRTKLKDVAKGPAAEILARTSHLEPRSVLQIVKQSVYSTRLVRETLSQMTTRGVLRRVKSDAVLLNYPILKTQFDVYCFEIKLKDWKRALRQAVQAAMYSRKAYVVMPESRLGLIRKNRAIFRVMGVGALVINPTTGQLKYLYNPRGSRHKIARFKYWLALELSRRRTPGIV